MYGAPANPVPPPTKTPSVKKTSWTDVLNGLIYVALSVAAVYYGWIYGQKYALQYWMTIQVLGSTIRDYLIRLIARIREYASKQTV